MRKAAFFLAILLFSSTAWSQLPTPAYKPASPSDPAKSAAEAGALGYMRTVLAAEKVFKQKHGFYAGTLAALVNSGSFTRRMTRTDRGDYTVSFSGGKQGFSLQLTPKQFAPDRRAFFVNQTGTLRVEESQPATAGSRELKKE